MKAQEFCYWLQGYFEINENVHDGGRVKPLSEKQVSCIQNHLKLVFKHDIDPQAGDDSVQEELNAIHTPGGQLGGGGSGLIRC